MDVVALQAAKADAAKRYSRRFRRRDIKGPQGLPKLATVVPAITVGSTAYGSYPGGTTLWNPVSNPGRFRTYGADVQQGAVVASTFSPANITPKNGNSFVPWALGFTSDAPIFEIAVAAFGGYYRILVDGEIVADTVAGPSAGGGIRYIRVDWSAVATPRQIRTYRIEFDAVYFTNILAGLVDTFYAAAPLGPRVIVVGDSYVEGTGSNGRFCNWVWQLGKLMGWDDMWASGSGGTGYLVTQSGAGKNNYRGRFANDVAPYTPDMLLFSGGRNDAGSFTPSQIGTEAQTLYTLARTTFPNAVIGTFGNHTSATPDASAIAIHSALSTAAAAAGILFLDVQNPSPIIGTGHVGGTTNNGNADFATSADGVHPTPFGHDLLARSAAAQLGAALSGL